jgi:hypothetical protein
MKPRIKLIGILAVAVVSTARAQDFHWTLFGGFSTNNNPNPQIPFGILPPPPLSPSSNLGAANTFVGGFQVQWRFDQWKRSDQANGVGRWLGVGFDLAGIFPAGGKVFESTIGTFSPNAYGHIAKWPDWLHFPDPDRMDVYATGGYTALFQQFGANGFNVGGGVNFWGQTNGWMVEYRYVREVGTNAPVTGSPYNEIRVGWIHRTGSP